jgi:hypothetical protein
MDRLPDRDPKLSTASNKNQKSLFSCKEVGEMRIVVTLHDSHFDASIDFCSTVIISNTYSKPIAGRFLAVNNPENDPPGVELLHNLKFSRFYY